MGSPKPGHSTRPTDSEDEIVERIRVLLGGGTPVLGLDDDCAVVALPGGGSVVVSVDSVVEGVHVDLDLCHPSDVGWKGLMRAASDLAAMGATPVGALVALCIPGGATHGAVSVSVMEGVAEAARAIECPVVGGDVSSGPTLVVSVTVLGSAEGGVQPLVHRSGAGAGDGLYVTGPCGASAAGLRLLRRGDLGEGAGAGVYAAAAAYRRPWARLEEGLAAREAGAKAMIDISDGLALDLHRLADRSHLGFALDEVPLAPEATEDEALGGGEDYELLVAMDPSHAAGYERRCADAGLRPPVRIGTLVGDITSRTWRGAPVGRLGWQHEIG